MPVSAASELVDPGASAAGVVMEHVAALDASSPISDEALKQVAERVARRFKFARKRLDKAERKRVRAALSEVYALVEIRQPELSWQQHRRKRLEIAKELEQLSFFLLGSEGFVPDFYSHGRLAIVRAFDPVMIRETIDPARVEQHFSRYLDRAERAMNRLEWFMARCGLEPEREEEEIPHWERPYSKLESYRELLWGTPRRKKKSRSPYGG